MFAKIVLALGIVGFLLGIVAAGAMLALPFITEGRVDMEEALIGFIPAVIFMLLSLFVALIGLIFVVRGRKS